MRAEQFGQREASALRLQVPQRDVEGADRLRRQAASAHRSAGPRELVPEPGDVARVFTDQRRSDLFGVRELSRTTGAFRVAESQTLVTVSGLDLREQNRDLGHRLLAAGQHLGVADRRGERQVAGRHANPCDAVLSGETRFRHVSGYVLKSVSGPSKVASDRISSRESRTALRPNRHAHRGRAANRADALFRPRPCQVRRRDPAS